MHISTKARYAVAALADLSLATKDKTQKTVSLRDVAERQELPTPYLEQIFAKLRKANLVQSVRGAYGGYTLARPFDNIRIADIIYAVDTPARATRCDRHTSKGCMSTGERCLTHDLWEGLDLVIHHYFSQITLRDIVERGINHLPFNTLPQEKNLDTRTSCVVDFNTVITPSRFLDNATITHLSKEKQKKTPSYSKQKGGDHVL